MATQTAEELEQEFLELLKAQTTAAQPFVATEGEVDQTYPDADELRRQYQATIDYQSQSINTPEDEEDFLKFLETLGRSVDSMQQMGYSFAGVIGEATEWDRLKEWSRAGVEQQKQDMAEYAKKGETIQATDLLKKFNTEDEDLKIGDVGIWLRQTAGDVVPPLVVSASSMWAGAAIGGAIAAPIPIPGARAVGVGVGMAAGMLLPSYVLGVGEIDVTMKERAGEDFEAPAQALIGGIPIALLDAASLALQLKPIISPAVKKFGAKAVVDQLVKQGVKKNVAKVATVSAIKNMPVEGVTEASQEYIADLIAEVATGIASTDQEKIDMMINAGSKGAVGGILGGGTFETIAAVQHNKMAAEQEEIEGWRDAREEEVERGVEEWKAAQPEQGLDNLDANQLRNFWEGETKEKLVAPPGSTREEVLNEILSLKREELWGNVLAKEVSKDTLADVTREELIRKYLFEFDEMTSNEVASIIDEEFMVESFFDDISYANPTQQLVIKLGTTLGINTPDTLNIWLDKHGIDRMSEQDISGATASGFLHPEIEKIKKAMAEDMADRIMEQKGDTAVSKLGLFQFNQWVNDLMEKYTLAELRSIAKLADMYGSTNKEQKMTKFELATHIAEEKAQIELQRQKLGPYLDAKSKQTFLINLQTDEMGTITKEKVADGSNMMGTGAPTDMKLNDLIGVQGNAHEVSVDVIDPNVPRGSPGRRLDTIVFKRYGPAEFERIKGREIVDKEQTEYSRDLPQRSREEFAQTAFDIYNETEAVQEGIMPRREMSQEEKDFIQQKRRRGGELSTQHPLYQGMTLDEFMNTKAENEYELVTARITKGQLMHEQFTNKFLSFLSTRFRPFGPMGLVGGLARRQMIANTRVIDNLAKDLGVAIGKAMVYAHQQGDISGLEDGNRLLMAYLKKTGSYRKVTAREKELWKNEIERMEMELGSLYVGTTDYENLRSDIETQKFMLEGGETRQRRRIALEQLPESLHEIALRSRKTVDSLSERILKEIPEELLPTEQRPIVQENLGRYLTSSFRIFEPSLGWNPRISSAWNPEHQKLIDNAIVSLDAINENNLAWRTNKKEVNEKGIVQNYGDAINEIDAILKMEKFSSASDVARLPGILKAVSADQAIGLPSKTGLLRERYEIPYAIKKLMGEETDPALAIATSVSRIGKLLEMAKFYQEMKQINEMPGEMHFSPVSYGNYSVPISALGDWNPLQGYYTTPEFANELEIAGGRDSFFDTDTIAWYRTWILAPKAAVQFGKIVLSPATQMRNFMGGAIMFLGNGHWRLGSFPIAMDAVAKELFGTGIIRDWVLEPGQEGKYYNKGVLTDKGARAERMYRAMQRLMIVNTNVRMNDILGIFGRAASGEYNSYNQFVDALYVIKNSKGGKIGSAPFEKILTTAKEFYAAADDFWKIAAFAAERIKLKEGLRKAESFSDGPLSEQAKMDILMEYAETLTTKTYGTVHNQNMKTAFRNVTDLETLMDEIAAYHVRMGIPNYDYVGRFARTWRQIAVVGNFIAFPTEMARVSFNIPQIAMKQATFKVSPKTMEKYGLRKETILYRYSNGQIGSQERNLKPFTFSSLEKGIGFSLAAGGLGSIAVATGKAIFDVDDDELDAARLISAEWAQNDLLIPIGSVRSQEDGGGFPALNGNYILPWSEISKLWPIIEKNIREADRLGNDDWTVGTMEGIVEWVAEYTDQYLGQAISVKTQRALRNNRDPDNGDQIFNPDAPLGEIVKDILSYAWKDVAFGAYFQGKTLRRAFAKGEERFDKNNRTVDKKEAIMKTSGLSPVLSDPTESMPYIVSNTLNYRRFTVQPTMQQAIGGGPMPVDEIFKYYKDAQSFWFIEQQRLYELLQAVKTLNINEEVYTEQMKRFKGMGKDFVENIEDGIFTPWKMPDFYKEKFEENTEEMIEKQIKDGRDPNLITRYWPEEDLDFFYDILKESEISLLGNSELPFPWEED